jgi:hypothetical protein
LALPLFPWERSTTGPALVHVPDGSAGQSVPIAPVSVPSRISLGRGKHKAKRGGSLSGSPRLVTSCLCGAQLRLRRAAAV